MAVFPTSNAQKRIFGTLCVLELPLLSLYAPFIAVICQILEMAKSQMGKIVYITTFLSGNKYGYLSIHTKNTVIFSLVDNW